MTSTIDPIHDALRHRAFKCAGKHEPRCRTLLAFLHTSDRIRAYLKHSLSTQQLTETGFRILATLFAHEDAPLSPTQISSLASMWPPTVTDVLTRLEISGLIVRERSTTDRRQILTRLTPAGRKHYTSAVDHLVGDMVRLAEPIAPAEFTVLRTACDHLDSRVAQLAEDAPAPPPPPAPPAPPASAPPRPVSMNL
ncbi:MAG: MarR family transcriptional regulator [Opitutaceae bacterium]|jgi:DNA-binding MarR family transcriptional regulator|nr:MarR family transcriptional regulator [Opitutaceae bacterium]